MKIAFVGFQKNEKNMPELAARLAKKGHRVFAYPSLWSVLFKDFDIIHTSPEYSKAAIFLAGILKRKTIFTNAKIPDGIDAARVENFECLKKWNLQRGGYILYSGRIARKKNIHTLIEAFKMLEDKHLAREKKLVIASGGGQSKEYLNELKDMVRGRENIIFLEPQGEEELAQLFSHCYFFADASEIKKLSKELLLAMGYGKVAIISEAGKNNNLLSNETALFFHSENSVDLEENMVCLINNPLLAKEMGERSAQKLRQERGWDGIAERMEIAYNDKIFSKNKISLTKSNERNI